VRSFDYYVVRTAQYVQRESTLRSHFVETRLGHAASGLEAMDLTSFMHGGPAKVVSCTLWGVMRRTEVRPSDYESDRYDAALMRHLYPRYRQALTEKRKSIEPLLAPGAEVPEVGSHLGAFLETAQGWGWRPIGLDIGPDTSAFARRQGGTVRQTSLDDYYPVCRPDAIFFWNCFEQLSRPWEAMLRARSMLSPHGLVLLRVPNADFYRRQAQWLRALSYNNLLGFPYLNGYHLPALKRLLTSSGFELVASFATSLLMPPYPDSSAQVRGEWQQTRIDTEHCGAADSPWIEIVGRATSTLNII